MERRASIVGLASVTGWPLAAAAQQTPKVWRIGVLVPANPEPFWSVLRGSLRELGYVEQQNVQFEFRSAEGKPNLLPDLAAELVRLNVDIIIASQTPAVRAAKQATSEIPIIMGAAGDPVGTGLIASLARPGGNITGMSGTTAELGGKTLELIREMLPGTRRVAVLANATDSFTKSFLDQIEAGGSSLKLAIQTIMVRGAEEFEAAFAAMMAERADAVIVATESAAKAGPRSGTDTPASPSLADQAVSCGGA